MGHPISLYRHAQRRCPVPFLSQTTVCSITSNASIYMPPPAVKQSILIWYDPNIHRETDEQTKMMFSNITDHVRFFVSEPNFLNHIHSHEVIQKNVFLILSKCVTREILHKIHPLPQLISVYIYDDCRDKYEFLLSEFRKITDVYTNADDLSAALKADIAHAPVFNFYSTETQNSTRDLTKDAAEFIWFQLLHELLLKLPYHTEQAKQEFLTHCRNYYRESINEFVMNDIDAFERHYQSKNSILEYTKSNFVSRIVNQALRTEDVDQLFALRYYIVDLCKSLEEQSKNFRLYQSFKRQPNIKVYRGQQMKAEELEKIRANTPGLIATNSFLSTSFDTNVAGVFAGRTTNSARILSDHNKNDTQYYVVFEIDVHLVEVQSIILADISKISQFGQEKEVLFGLGATFYVTGIEEREGIHYIHLQATDDGRKIAEEYRQLKLRDIPYSSSNDSINFIIFGQLLIQMGECQKAVNFFKNLLPQNEIDFSNRTTTTLEPSYAANILFNLGDAYLSGENYDEAVKYLAQSLEQFVLLKAKTGIALSKARLASALVSKEQYNDAYKNFKEAMKLYKQMPNQELNIAYCENGLGDMYISQENYSRARIHIRRAYNRRKQQLPKAHPDIATSQYNLGRLCYLEGDNDQIAQQYLEEALNCKRKIFPSYHNSIGCNLHVLGQVYESLGDRNEALQFLREANECYQQKSNGEQSRKKIEEVQQDINRISTELSREENKLKKTVSNGPIIKLKFDD